MNHTEHTAKNESPRTGLSAMLRAFLPGAKGNGAPSRSNRIGSRSARLSLFVTLLIGLVAVVGVAPALAASPPEAFSFTPSSVGETSATLSGVVNPQEAETEWQFEFSTEPEAGFAKVGNLETLPFQDSEYHPVEFTKAGLSPDSSYYFRLFAENSNGAVTSNVERFETTGPPTAETISTHGLDGDAIRVDGYVIPHGFDTHYYFQFGKTAAYEGPSSPTASAGVGTETTVVGADLTGLEPGATYHYRLVATSGASGGAISYGADRSLTVPTPAPTEPQLPCPNAPFRVGPSAKLPDCRAYELVTPIEKGGAQDLFNFGAATDRAGLSPDGAHVRLRTLSKLGSSTSPLFTDYVFTRQPGDWQMTSLTPPGAGENTYLGEVFSADFTNAALARFEEPTLVGHGPEQELLLGPSGGPYASAATTPYNQKLENGEGKDMWAGANPSLSKLVLMTSAHQLPGLPSTATTEGHDLYEYSQGQLRQLNVFDDGSTIGTCGARLPIGFEDFEGYVSPFAPHAVSKDGSKVFFEAVPGSSASCPTRGEYELHQAGAHLYMRVNGAETVDIGPYTFDAASPDGSTLLLGEGQTHIALRYDSETRMLTPFSTFHGISEEGPPEFFTVSDDASTVYFKSKRQLTPDAPPLVSGGNSANWYVFDVASESLRFVMQSSETSESGSETPTLSSAFHVTADGRYFYYLTAIAGQAGLGPFRYDRLTETLTCIACTPFHPAGGGAAIEGDYFEAAEFGFNGQLGVGFNKSINGSGTPRPLTVSDDGSYAFFTTTSALVTADVDGEEAEGTQAHSHSRDVYEWRANGITGCTRPAGCVALLSNGVDGLRNLFLGATPSGHDVLIATHSQLLPADQDSGGDLYVVSIDGGTPPPLPPQVECEGDSCASPLPAPNDPTPASSTYNGPGNVHPRCKKAFVKRHARCVKVRRHHRRHHKDKASRHHKQAASHNSGGGK